MVPYSTLNYRYFFPTTSPRLTVKEQELSQFSLHHFPLPSTQLRLNVAGQIELEDIVQ